MGEAHPDFRFVVRRGYKGWMVYDRQRKGPAMIGTNPAVDLSEERANNLKCLLAQADANRKLGRESGSHGREDWR